MHLDGAATAEAPPFPPGCPSMQLDGAAAAEGPSSLLALTSAPSSVAVGAPLLYGLAQTCRALCVDTARLSDCVHASILYGASLNLFLRPHLFARINGLL